MTMTTSAMMAIDAIHVVHAYRRVRCAEVVSGTLESVL